MSFATACREELRLVYTALQFFTRVPVPAWTWSNGWRPEQLSASARHFPLVGVLVGAVCGLVLLAALPLLPPAAAVVLSMAVGLLLTGAFHEDGFADSCDGFGGGAGREQVLEIMKDSRVGSYATVGVWAMLTFKWSLLVAMCAFAPGRLLAMVIASHAASRAAALWVMARLPYQRDDARSKSKPMAHRVAGAPLLWALGVTALACAPLGLAGACGALVTAWLVAEAAVRYLRRRLGGYVGDALGATQQIAEVAVLATGWVVATGPWT